MSTNYALSVLRRILWVVLFLFCAAPVSAGSFDWKESLEENQQGFVFHGFAALGLDVLPSEPSLRTTVREIEWELDWNVPRVLRVELALQVFEGAVNPGTEGLRFVDQMVQKASVKFQLPAQLFLLAGRYISYQGWESPNNAERLQISGSFVANLTPNTLNGVALGWSTTLDKATLELQVYGANRFDSNTQRGLVPSGGLFATVSSPLPTNGSVQIAGSVNLGKEPAITAPSRGDLSVLNANAYLLVKLFSERWWLLGDLFLVQDPASGDAWWAFSFTTHLRLHKAVALTLRCSLVQDEQKLRTAAGENLSELSAALIFKPLQLTKTPMPSALRQSMVLLEGRLDTQDWNFSKASGQVQLSVIVPFQIAGLWKP